MLTPGDARRLSRPITPCNARGGHRGLTQGEAQQAQADMRAGLAGGLTALGLIFACKGGAAVLRLIMWLQS